MHQRTRMANSPASHFRRKSDDSVDPNVAMQSRRQKLHPLLSVNCICQIFPICRDDFCFDGSNHSCRVLSLTNGHLCLAGADQFHPSRFSIFPDFGASEYYPVSAVSEPVDLLQSVTQFRKGDSDRMSSFGPL